MSEVVVSRSQQLAPHSENFEQAVLASVLVNPASFDLAAQFVGAEHFYFLRHVYIWQSWQQLRADGSAIDYITTIEQLKQTRRLDDVTETYLIQIMRLPVNTALAGVYAEEVMQRAVRRKTLVAAEKIGELARREDLALEDITQATQDLLALSQADLDKVRIRSIEGLVSQHFDRTEIAIDTGGAGIVVPTGIATLDGPNALCGGLVRGKYHIFFAQPHLGKTATALSVAVNACRDGLNVLFVSTETSADDITNKLLAMVADISPMRLSRGELNEDEHRRYVTSAGQVAEFFTLAVDDSRPLTPRIIWQRIKTLQSQWGRVDLVIVDWLQQLAVPATSKARTYYEQCSETSENLRVTAEKLDVPLLVFAQERRPERAAKDKRPSMNRIEGSGQIAQDADLCVGIYRHGFYEPNMPQKWRVEYSIQKNRLSGKYGVANACMNPTSGYISAPAMGTVCAEENW